MDSPYAVLCAMAMVLLGLPTISLGAGPTVAILAPGHGATGDIVTALREGITARGGIVLTEETSGPEQPAPDCIVVSGDMLNPADRPGAKLIDRLGQHLATGGSVAILFGPHIRSTEQAAAFCAPYGGRLARTAGRAEPVNFIRHALTDGLSSPTALPLRVAIGGIARPLATQGDTVVSAWIPAGTGGIVLIPTDLVAVSGRRSAGDKGLAYLVRACLWSAGELSASLPAAAPEAQAGGDGRRRPPGAPPPAPLPEEGVAFAGVVLVDSRAADESWPAITPALLAELRALDLPLRALAIRADVAAPLALALASNPPLVVLGSWREFSEPELVALEHYLWGGGRVLVAASSGRFGQMRLAYVNMLTGPLGILIRYPRSAGPATVSDQLAQPAASLTIAEGVRIVGAPIELVSVPEGVVAGAASYGRGALLALDAGPLANSPQYATIVGQCLRWLVSFDAPGDG